MGFTVLPFSDLTARHQRFEVFTAVKNQVKIFCAVARYSAAAGYQCLRRLCYLHLRGHPEDLDLNSDISFICLQKITRFRFSSQNALYRIFHIFSTYFPHFIKIIVNLCIIIFV